MSKITKLQEKERSDAINHLRAVLPPGTVVHTILRHVSASGMSRSISLAVVKDGELSCIDWHVRKVTGDKWDEKRGGLKVSGCGMDMGFELVYRLGRYLYPDGFGVWGKHENGPKRPLNPVHAAKMASEGVVFHGRNGDTSGWDNDGGYALVQRWL